MNRLLLYLLTSTLLFSCGEKKSTQSVISVESIASPAGASSAEPFLFTDQKGRTLLSWIEKTDTAHVFKFSRWGSGSWLPPTTIAYDSTWFVNWADYPMIASNSSSQMAAHVLNKSAASTYAYDVKMYASSDSGRTWNNSFVLHDDAKQAEHGFVSLLPYGENLFVSWLDGRNTVMEGMDNMESHEGHQGAMSVRGAVITYTGEKIDEWELDNKTCDCCQTTAALTDNGPIVVYRDRSDDEIRDMSIVRLVNGEWTEPKTIYQDNWKIKGCPVNGPRASSIGNNLAIAWFGMVNEKAQVKVVFSADGGETLSEPIRIDEGKPIGRVDIEMIDNNRAMVTWMEGTEIKGVEVNTDGSKGTSFVIAKSSEARASGFPQMTKNGNELIFAWTDDGEKRVMTATKKL